MRIIFYGNRNTGLYILSYLVASGYDIKVITDGDKNIEQLTKYYNLPLVTLDTMGDYDLFICCHGRKIISNKYLKEGKFINLHPCLFKYKGHNPVRRYLKNGNTIGSIESHYLVEEVDGGDVIYRAEFETGKIDTYAEFYNIALPYYFKVIHETLKIINE